ncbi:DUF2062 domain-containing protein [Bacillus sp. B15-48]|uniref:DUF2062 domain-containing protein n=1 Tax=Bacillus sp. B15-48 TaxID=1548601 RepID=UPI00193F9AD2|nr:DUF2062 domain-containing protein [Bacillus sp. B15-48]MBM4761499.1 DUF2062 domain-containing protein [Bacillus sp. B15-48]
MKLKRRSKYFLIRLFRLKASPHHVAMGLALGFAPNWFPTFGLGPFFSAALAKLTRVNVLAAFIGGLIGTPLWPVLFWLNYQVGSLFYQKPSKVEEIVEVEYLEAVNDTVGSWQSGSMQFITGSLVNMFVMGIIMYILVYFLFKKYRMSILTKIKY